MSQSGLEIITGSCPHLRQVRQWLVNLLNDGKIIFIYLMRPLETSPGRLSSRMRKTLLHLYPFVKDGQLQIGVVKKWEESQLTSLPRVFIEATLGSPAWFSGRPTPSILVTVQRPLTLTLSHQGRGDTWDERNISSPLMGED